MSDTSLRKASGMPDVGGPYQGVVEESMAEPS